MIWPGARRSLFVPCGGGPSARIIAIGSVQIPAHRISDWKDAQTDAAQPGSSRNVVSGPVGIRFQKHSSRTCCNECDHYYEPTPNRVRALTRLVALLPACHRATLREQFMPEADSGGHLVTSSGKRSIWDCSSRTRAKSRAEEPANPRDVTDDAFFSPLSGRAADPTKRRPQRIVTFCATRSAWRLRLGTAGCIDRPEFGSASHYAGTDGRDNCYDVINEGRFAMLATGPILGYAAGAIGWEHGRWLFPIPLRRSPGVWMGSSAVAATRHWPVPSALESGLSGTRDGRRASECGRTHASETGRRCAVAAASSLALWRLESRRAIKLTHASDAATWLMASTIASADAGKARAISHIESGAGRKRFVCSDAKDSYSSSIQMRMR